MWLCCQATWERVPLWLHSGCRGLFWPFSPRCGQVWCSCWLEGCQASRRPAESSMHQNWTRLASALSGLSCCLRVPWPCHWWQVLSGCWWPAGLVCPSLSRSALPLDLLSASEASDTVWARQHIAAPRPAGSSQGLSALAGSALYHRVHRSAPQQQSCSKHDRWHLSLIWEHALASLAECFVRVIRWGTTLPFKLV